LIDRIEPRGCADLIADFAFRLPVILMCHLLGMPEDHQTMFFAGARGHGQHLDRERDRAGRPP
jgi:cytochrome P450